MHSHTRSVVRRAAELRRAGIDWDSVMKQLRDEGNSKLHCILAIAKIDDMPMGDANEMVHFSPVWEDRREQATSFTTI